MDAALAHAQLAAGRDRAFWTDRAVSYTWKLHTGARPETVPEGAGTHPPTPNGVTAYFPKGK